MDIAREARAAPIRTTHLSIGYIQQGVLFNNIFWYMLLLQMIFMMMWTVFSTALFFAGITHSCAKLVLSAAVPSASLLIALLS